MSEAKEFAVIMAFAAFRICLGIHDKQNPKDVFRWMRLMLSAAPQKADKPSGQSGDEPQRGAK